jgi:prepilin-type N-terminal cleavage/methylation domain-containing protein
MKKRGFTLVEMIAVTVIITVLASIVVGRLQNSRDGINFQRGIQSIESAANKAKNEAVTSGRTYELTFDDGSQSLVVAPVETDDASGANNAPAGNNGGGSNSSLGGGWSVREVRLPDGTADSELRIKFYADGTSENKTVEFTSGDAPVTMTVKQNGSIDVRRGSITDTDVQEWEAGNIEQRTNQQ